MNGTILLKKCGNCQYSRETSFMSVCAASCKKALSPTAHQFCLAPPMYLLKQIVVLYTLYYLHSAYNLNMKLLHSAIAIPSGWAAHNCMLLTPLSVVCASFSRSHSHTQLAFSSLHYLCPYPSRTTLPAFWHGFQYNFLTIIDCEKEFIW